MKLPNTNQIAAAMLRAASGSGISDESLRNTVTFECSVYAGPTACNPSKEQIEAFQQELAGTQERLLNSGFLARPEPGLCVTTPLGAAFLANGCMQSPNKRQRRPKEANSGVAPSAAASDATATLGDLLERSSLHYYERLGDNNFGVSLRGDLRSWCVGMWVAHGWLCTRTYVMPLGSGGLRRSGLFEAALQESSKMAACKLSVVDDMLFLDCECRFEHLTTEELQKLLGHIASTGDKCYPRLFQAATDETALESLDAAFKKGGESK